MALSRIRRRVSQLIIIIILGGVLLGPVYMNWAGVSTAMQDGDLDGASAVIIVDGEEDGDNQYATIQAAVDNATANDRIEVESGVYPEAVTINKDIELIAPNGATLDGSSLHADAIAIESSKAENGGVIAGFTIQQYDQGISISKSVDTWSLQNLTITNTADSDYTTEAAIAARDVSAPLTVRNVYLSGNEIGIDVSGSEGNITLEGARIVDSADKAIVGSSSTEIHVRGSTLRANGGGLNAESVDTLIVSDTKIADNADSDYATEPGIMAAKATTQVSIDNVTVENNDFGIDVSAASTTVRIQNSSITHNDGKALTAASSRGLVLRETPVRGNGGGVDVSELESDFVLENITIANNADSDFDTEPGLAASGIVDDITLRNITLRNNDVGLDISDTSGRVVISKSSINDNSNNAILGASAANVLIETSVVRANGGGIDAESAETISITDTKIVDNADSDFSTEPGIMAAKATTQVSIDNVTIENNEVGVDISSQTSSVEISRTEIESSHEEAIYAKSFGGSLNITSTTISGNGDGVVVDQSTGSITIEQTNVTGTGESDFDSDPAVGLNSFSGEFFFKGGVIKQNEEGGIDASESNGDIQITQSILEGNSQFDIDGRDAAKQVGATTNWWGSTSGPEDSDCLGNVNCGNHLTTPLSS